MSQIDVYIPVYNRKIRVGRAIASCLAQEGVDVRVLVSDNASTDGTWDMLQKMAAQDPRLVPTRNAENIGMLPNINRMIELVDRPFYMFLCSDDHLIDSRAFAKAMALMDTYPEVQSVYCDMQFQYSDGTRIIDNRFVRPAVFDPKAAFIGSLIRTRNGFGIPLLHRTEAGLSHPYRDDCVYASDVLHSYMVARGQACGHIAELCIGNTYSDDNMTRGMMDTALRAFRVAEEISGMRLTPLQRLRQSLNHRLVFLQKLLFFKVFLPLRKARKNG